MRRVTWLVAILVALTVLALSYWAKNATTEAVITVEWTTASELDTAGFNLYRADNPDGPFVRVNAHLIPASNDPLAGSSYVFTDTDVVAGHTYYYELEDVETGGGTVRHGPVEVKAEAQGRPQMLLIVLLLAAATVGLVAVAVLMR